MPEPHLLPNLSLALFAVTALSLLGAYHFGQSAAGRVLAIASIATVCAANYAMLKSYQGEKSWESQWAGPIERRNVQRRGGFEYVDKDEPGDNADGSAAGGQAATSGSGGAGSDGPAGANSVASRQFAGLFSRLGLAAQAGLQREVLRDCQDCPDMVVVEPGFLQMGAAPGDADALPTELPRRLIKVSRPFAIGRSEVTVSQYMAFANSTGRAAPSCAGLGDRRDTRAPVACVGWGDASAYAAWLAATTGRPYRLPTEAEWEWAARGGSADRFTTGAALARRATNGFGLAGVHGGVAELVQGCWSDTLGQVPADSREATRSGDCNRRVMRDAGSGEADILARLSARRPIGREELQAYVGFRIARDL